MQQYADNAEKKWLKRNMLSSVFTAGNKTQEIYWAVINVPKLPQYMQLKQIDFRNPNTTK